MKLNILNKPTQPDEVLRYDYSRIADADERAVVISAAMAIKPMMRRAAEDLVRIGHELIAVKDYLPHGQFTPWLEAEFGLHERTARRMMAVAERLGHKMDTLSVLAPSILYELAADSTPNDVIRRVEGMVASGETLTTRDVRSVIAAVPNGKVVYMQPEPSANGNQAEAPTGPTQADRSLTVDQTVDMIEKARTERSDCPELATYKGAGWAVYLADTYGFWPTVDTAKQAIGQILRSLPKSATRRNVLDALTEIGQTVDVMVVDTRWLIDYATDVLKRQNLIVDKEGMMIEEIQYWREQKAEELRRQPRPLDATETAAVIARILERNFDNDVDRLMFLDKAGPDAYVEAVSADRFINSELFNVARADIRKEIAPRAAKEAAKRQEEARVAAVRHDKQTMLASLTSALAALPEAAEDTYYDLTGTTHYSAARQAILKAIKEIENTMEAKRV